MEVQIFLQQLPNNFNFPENEKFVLIFWKNNNIYAKIVLQNQHCILYNFQDGPPFVSGTLHQGHCHVGMMKSSNNNYWTMKGYNVLNKIGYDVHGLPTEMAANKSLGLKTNDDIKKYGLAKYNSFCVDMIQKLMGSWHPIFDRIGRFANYENEYKTMDLGFMESTWWAWNQLWNKNLIYRGYKIMPYSIECGTSLSASEATGDDVYKEVSDLTTFVKFQIKGKQDTFFVAWTTTPWTLPSNLALAMNSKLEYITIKDNKTQEYYIVSKNSPDKLYPPPKKEVIAKPYEIISVHLGSEFENVEYVPVFSYFNERTFTVHMADFVDETSGTGIVHLAPAFGQEDFDLCIKKKIVSIEEIGKYCPIDENGYFTSRVSDFQGLKVFDANLKIVQKLIEDGKLVRKENYRHRYPHCWRTDTPLIQKAVSSFFVKASALREKMVKNNEKVRWVPEQIGTGRFKQWIENAADWGVSRSRFFGTPIPIWISDDGEEMVSVGSIQELCDLAGLDKLDNIHPEFIKDITIPSKTGRGVLRWCQDVLDCWFESACVPIAQYHYPFENKEMVDKIIDTGYMSELVSEGLDQCNKWFYVLMVISTALFDIPAYKNVICNGLILAEDGQKFSKRLSNFTPPMQICDDIGADALRMYFVGSPAAHGGSFTFDKEKISEINFKYFQWVNATKFFIEHLTKYQKDGNYFKVDAYLESTNVTDNWILSRLGNMVTQINSFMAEYTIYKVKTEILDFIEDLTNWYIKFNRNRLRGRYCDKVEQGKALSTLYRALIMFTQITAPFVPFLSETLYLALKPLLPTSLQKESVHMCSYPMTPEFPDDQVIIRRMKRLQLVARMVRALRSKSEKFHSAKVPIKNVTITHEDDEFIGDLKIFEKYMYEELNTIKINYLNHIDAKYKIEPNNKQLGLTYKKAANLIKEKLALLSQDEIKQYLENKDIGLNLKIQLDGSEVSLPDNMFTVIKDEALSLNKNEMGLAEEQCIVILDTTYDNEVIELYLMRLFIVTVQKMRKNTNLRPWNKIGIYYQTNSEAIKRTIITNQKNINEELFYEVKYLEDSDIINEKVIVSDTFTLEGETLTITITDQYSDLQNI